MADLEFKSPKDGSVLAFTLIRKTSEGETDFEVAVKTPDFTGIAPASTYFAGSPSTLFRAMADEWQGWKGPKEWKDLETRVAFSAQSDSTGHVMLSVELTGQDYDSHLRVVLQYEAGQLEGMANEIAQLLG
jgi:hypothetical protein